MISSIISDNILYIDEKSYSRATPKEQIKFIQENISNSEDFVISSNIQTRFSNPRQVIDYYLKEPKLALASLKQKGLDPEVLESFNTAMQHINTFIENSKSSNDIFKRLGVSPLSKEQWKDYRITATRFTRIDSLGRVSDNFIHQKDFKTLFCEYLAWFEDDKNSSSNRGHTYLIGHGDSFLIIFTKTGVKIGCKEITLQELAAFADHCGFDGDSFKEV